MKSINLFQLLMLALLILVATSTMAQYDSLRVMYYNVLNFPVNSDPNREDDFRIINQFVKPDIILANEVLGVVGAQALLNNSLNVYGTSHFQQAVFTDGPDSDNMLYYNSDKLILHSQWYITTALRYINEYVLYYKSPDLAQGGDTIFLYFYSAHLKANESETTLRLAEINEFRDRVDNLPDPENIFFGGDLNLYTSQEPAYDALTNQGVYPLNDPLPAVDWHDNYNYRHIHTQSTRTSQFGGGATGGLDDRFDFILFSDDVLNGSNKVQYIDNSCKAIGNDGNHFNTNLFDPVANSEVPDSVVNALYYMSDHLPVICDIRIETTLPAPPTNLVISEIMYNPPESGQDSLEFIEIFNFDSEPINLLGYHLSGVDFVFPNIVLSSGEFVVTAVNAQAMLNTFGVFSYQWTSGALINGGEIITLTDPLGTIVESVTYDDASPWPTEADGGGPSIMFCDPSLDNSLGTSWAVSTNFIVNNLDGNPIYASPGFSECGLPPVADFMAGTTLINEGENIVFTDQSLNDPISWSWNFPGGNPLVSTDQNPIVNYAMPGEYNVQLFVSNAFGDDILVKGNYISVLSSDPVLVITEIMQNPLEVGDTGGEWFELFNPTSAPIDLLNWEISDNGVDFHKIISSVIVPPNGFIILGRNDDSGLNGNYTCDYEYSSFLLSNGDDEIILHNPLGTEVDRVEYDGGPNWPDPNGPSMVYTGTAIEDNTDYNLWTTSSLRELSFIGTAGDKGSPGSNGTDQNVQSQGFDLDLKVYLEGTYNGFELDAHLNGILPLTQPYSGSPWNYLGSENISTIPNIDIVDWVLVEVRDAINVASANISTKITSQAAFIKTDGTIVGMDGVSALHFSNTINNQLFIVIHHRNHLSIISKYSPALSEGNLAYDFSTASDQAYGGSLAQEEISPGVFGMISADGNADGVVNANDLLTTWSTEVGKEGYLNSDFDMNGQTNNKDKNDNWLPSKGNSTQVPN